MSAYLTIPEIVESEPILSLSPAPDGVTFSVYIDVGDTVVHLTRVYQDGLHLPLVVLTTDHQILALDSVYVTEVSFAGDSTAAHVTFAAQEVRFV
jgi:hypothetical protein